MENAGRALLLHRPSSATLAPPASGLSLGASGETEGQAVVGGLGILFKEHGVRGENGWISLREVHCMQACKGRSFSSPSWSPLSPLFSWAAPFIGSSPAYT